MTLRFVSAIIGLIATFAMMSDRATGAELTGMDRSVPVTQSKAGALLLRSEAPRTMSWRVAQDVSEKEAFELAKEANSIEVWEAYLIKFPHGFRAAIAKSYVNKLRAENGNSGGSKPLDDDDDLDGGQDAVDYVRAAELSGPYRIAARGIARAYLNNTIPGVVTVQPNALDRRSGHWLFEQVRGTKFLRIRNRWKRTLLHMDGQSVQAQRLPRTDRTAHWALERASDGSDHIVLFNRARKVYLWTDRDDRFLYVSKGKPIAPRGQWRLVSMEDNDRDDDDAGDEEEYGSDAPRITCIDGYVKNGRCRCSSGRKRVKQGRNRYTCKRVRIKCSRGEYYSKSRKKCQCRRGYERVGGECLRNEELDDDRGNTSCEPGFILRNGYCVCPRGKKNIQGVCRKPKKSGGTVRPKVRCSKIKFAFTRGNTCKCAGGRIFTGRACILPD